MMNNLNLLIANRLWIDEDFQKFYTLARINRQKINHGLGGSLVELPWKELVSAATTLAAVNEEDDPTGQFHTAALHIGLIAFQAKEDTLINVQLIFEFILSRLGHFPVIRLVDSSHSDMDVMIEKFSSRIPFDLQLEVDDHYSRNKVDNVVLTDLQRSFLNILRDTSSQVVSISAPTSAGKTFVLRYNLAEWFNITNNKIAVYVVPTRALISEVANDLRKSLTKLDAKVEVSTVGLPPTDSKGKYLFVLTQERLLSLLSQTIGKPDFQIGMLIIDEAQHIKDETRGPLLHQSIRWVIQEHRPERIVFSSPILKNSNVFQDIVSTPITANRFIKKSKKSPVIQNIITIHRVMRKPKLLELKLLMDASSADTRLIGQYEGETSWPTTINGYLAHVAAVFGKNSQNIIYVDSPPIADSVSDSLIKLLSPIENEELTKASEFIKSSVHQDYGLAKSLKYGVAVHYGFMPTLVRETIEHLFKDGHIKYLICTSTLAHGVNLPAQKLFMYEPKQRGNDKCKHSASADIFWNVAGRAGRLFNDFEGDVYLLHKLNEDWADQYFRDGKEIHLTSAIESLVREDGNIIAQHFSDSTQMLDEKGHELKGGEEASNVFFECHLQHGSINSLLAPTAAADLKPMSDLIDSGIELAKNRITIDWKVIRSNAGISPLRQQCLYERMQATFLPENLLLPKTNIYNPGSNWKEYRTILENVFLELDPEYDPLKLEGYYTHLVILACEWMNGESLKSLIEKAVDYARKNDPEKNVNTIVRGFLQKLDQWVRFKLVKFINCYHNLLEYHYIQIGRLDLIEKIPLNLPLYLEIGSCHPLEVALMKVGISRMTAIEITPYLSHIKDTHDIKSNILIAEATKLLARKELRLSEPYRRELQSLIS